MATVARPDDRTTTGRSTAGRLRLPLAAVLAVGLLGLTGCDLPAGFHDYVVFDGLNRPTSVEFSPDGRVFVTEKRGRAQGVRRPRRPHPHRGRRPPHERLQQLGPRHARARAPPRLPRHPRLYVAYTYDALPGGTAPRWGAAGRRQRRVPEPARRDGHGLRGRRPRLPPAAGGDVWPAPSTSWSRTGAASTPATPSATLAFGADGALYAGGGDGASFNWADHGQRGRPTRAATRTARAVRCESQDLRTDGRPVGLERHHHPHRPHHRRGAALQPAGGSPRRQRPPHRRPRAAQPVPVHDAAGDERAVDRRRRLDAPGRRSTARSATTAQVDNFGWPCMEGEGRTRGYDVLDLDVCEDLYAEGGVAVAEPLLRVPARPEGRRRAVRDRPGVVDLRAWTSPPSTAPTPTTTTGRSSSPTPPAAASSSCAAGGVGTAGPRPSSVFHHRAGHPGRARVRPRRRALVRRPVRRRDPPHRLLVHATRRRRRRSRRSPASGDPPLTVEFDACGVDRRRCRRRARATPGTSTATASSTTAPGRRPRSPTRRRARARCASRSPTPPVRPTRRSATDPRGHRRARARHRLARGRGHGRGRGVGAAVSGRPAVPGVGALPASALSWRADLLHCPRGRPVPPAPRRLRPRRRRRRARSRCPTTSTRRRSSCTCRRRGQGETTTVTRRVDYRTVDVTLAAGTPGVDARRWPATRARSPLSRR